MAYVQEYFGVPIKTATRGLMLDLSTVFPHFNQPHLNKSREVCFPNDLLSNSLTLSKFLISQARAIDLTTFSLLKRYYEETIPAHRKD